MTYDSQILQILTEVGEKGISVQLLSKNLYNLNSTLFYTPDFEEIRSYVQQYLLKNSKSAQSLVESTGRRGYYRLNTQNNADARQLVLKFKESSNIQDEKEEKPSVDLSLSLFDFD
ncbi:MAG: hypothetical protein IKQ86_03525 [Prevotella sp.]|jgi:hypothetical protein|nr:hypothetical protein [Prevotella sp.]MBR4191716.1 hypothetical protein [Prevotella sp.]